MSNFEDVNYWRGMEWAIDAVEEWVTAALQGDDPPWDPSPWIDELRIDQIHDYVYEGD